MTDRRRLLIEDWLPIAELGIESRREAAPIPGQFPKLKTLHVWWARRPLVAAQGALLASILPAWGTELVEGFPGIAELSDERSYRKWFLRLCGILGDPIAAKRAADRNKAMGVRAKANPYGYRPAFRNPILGDDLDLLHRVLVHTWGRLPAVLDPTAGGGSIPYQALRLGLPTIANDINGVAASILKMTLAAPLELGSKLAPFVEEFGSRINARIKEECGAWFPGTAAGRPTNYLHVRAVPCPRTGLLVPLAPNWWLLNRSDKPKSSKRAARPLNATATSVTFEIVAGADAEAAAKEGSVAGGHGVSPWDGLPIDGAYIKECAQTGRMSDVLYAVVYARAGGSQEFRVPDEADLAALAAADELAAREVNGWIAKGYVPAGDVDPDGMKTPEAVRYGMDTWWRMFSSRQLLIHAAFVKHYQAVCGEVDDEVDLPAEGKRSLKAALGMIQAKAIDYSSRYAHWDASRGSTRHTFERHDFGFKWTFAEFEGSVELYPWATSQMVEALDELATQLRPKGGLANWKPSVDVRRASAANMPEVESGSIQAICVDPPYYDNVMYGELSEFFSAWESLTVGRVWSEFLADPEPDIVNEAVANASRFASFGARKKELAGADYQAKMQAIFAECSRMLRDDGVMTVMFTHKRAEAWDTLGMALMEAGFRIATSWPVNTESEQSLHQAKKNAAASTVMLVCRKRNLAATSSTFFEDVLPDIKEAARTAVERFERDGIAGVDLLLSTYGPVLSVISAVWPVYSSEAGPDGAARLLRPEEGLDVAREELVEARRRALVGREVTFDPPTDFWLIAWELFQAEEFPYDEARRLALAVGGQDPETLASIGILVKKSGTVVLQTPSGRRRRVLRPVQDGELDKLPMVDILHAVLVTAELDGLAAAKTLMDRHGFTTDPRFIALVQGAVNAIPRTQKKGAFIRPEAAMLDSLVTAYLPSVSIPEDEPPDTLFDVE